MKNKHHRRGAALLLAISMMMLLALLGSTFMFVTRSYRQYSEIIESRGPVELLAAGIVNILAKEMHRDMWGPPLGSSDIDGFPYKTILNGNPGDASLRRRFGDSAGPAMGVNSDKSEDYWLSTFNIYENYAHGSNLPLGNVAATVHQRRAMFNAETGGWLNTAGNPEKDSVWQDTFVRNSMGQSYYVASRVIDLCGMLNVNTAGVYPPTEHEFMTPLDIDIDIVIPGGLATIESKRGSSVSTPSGRRRYFWDVSGRLHTPTGLFKPFTAGDEPAARVPLSANQGLRLAQLLDGIDDHTRTMLTTYSSNRNFLRRNQGEARQRINPNISYLKGNYPANALRSLDINNPEIRKGLYPQLREMIGNSNTAQDVVANLWAYCDNMQPDKDYEFTVNSRTVYGVVPRPVIAEAFCYHKKDTLTGTKDNSVKAYAMEIFNPTDAPVNLGEYTLGTIALSGTVSAGGYKVFYSYDAGDDASANDATPAGAFEGVSMAGWIELPSLDLSTAKTLKLNKGNIPVDVLKTADFPGYRAMATATGGPINIQRDDTRDIRNSSDPYTYEGRERYNVAFYATPGGINKLGQANKLTLGQMPLQKCYEDFGIVKKRKLADGHYICPSMGELFHLFAVSPIKGGKSLPELLFLKKTVGNRGKCVPTLPNAKFKYAIISWPLVLAEFVDVVPPDPYRDLSDVSGRDVYACQYGKINVNTAPAKVLAALPFPSGTFRFGMTTEAGASTDRTLAQMRAKAPFIVKHREKWKGLKSVGQILSGNVSGGTSGFIKTMYSGRVNRIGMIDVWVRWGRVLDVLTINSDSFAVILKISATNDDNKPIGANTVGTWRYLAVLDRSNCMNATDTPQIMLFMPLEE